jgi:hypothetical protein
MADRIKHSVDVGIERVDEPLIAETVRIGLARSPQLEDRVFVGVTFEGQRGGAAGYHGDVVLTLELAEAMAGLLLKAVAKGRSEGRSEGGGGEVGARDG